MGRVQMRAGGGKVTTENLTADNVRNGVAVAVKQGSKTVQSLTGTLRMIRLSIGEAGSYDIKELLPDHWQQLTTDNFLFENVTVRGSINNQLGEGWLSYSGQTASATRSYDPATGVLTVTLSGSSRNIDYKHGAVYYNTSIAGTCVCWYLS